MGFFSRLKALFGKKPKIKLGLALGSGGAKGMAHLGALKAFEEAGLSFAVVTGASIGGIVGALYAKGYSSADMVGIVENVNRKEFSKNLKPFSDMAFIESFLENYLEGDFSTLPIPFGVAVTDGITNKSKLLKEGNLARALTASAAIPPFFRGVEIGSTKYYDGAFSDAIPADYCKQLGADFVIGIDLSAFNPPEEEKSTIARLVGSAIAAMTPVRYLENAKTRGYEASDVMIRPNLRNIKATNIDPVSMDEMFEIGYAAAKAQIEEIKTKIDAWQKEKR